MKTIFNFSANIRIFFVKILFNHRLWGALNIFGGRTRKFLLSIRLYGELLILANQADKIIIEFNKHNNLIEQIADNKTNTNCNN